MRPERCFSLIQLSNSRAEEVINYISKAIEIKQKNENKNEVDILILQLVELLYNESITIYETAQKKYTINWQLRSAAVEYWEKLSKTIKIFGFINTLLDKNRLSDTDKGEIYYVRSLKRIIDVCIDICKQRVYVSERTKDGARIRVKINSDLHEMYTALYSSTIRKIMQIEPGYKPEEINWNKEVKGGCYIATCVYGSYDCPQVWTLRRYRDNKLSEVWYGRVLIKCYYAFSPILVKWFGEKSWFKKLWKMYLDKMVRKLNKIGIEETQYYDKIMICEDKQK